MEQSSHHRAELVKELEQPLEMIEEVPEWLGWAARLAALGDRRYLDEPTDPYVRERIADAKGLRQCVLERVREGVWDLENATGEFLAYAVVDAQDWTFLTKLEPPDWVNLDIRELIHGWSGATEDVVFDADGLYIIESYRDYYRFDKALLLPVVIEPLTVGHVTLLEQMADQLRAERQETRIPKKPAPLERLRLAASGQSPPAEKLRWINPQMSLICEADLLFDQSRVLLKVSYVDGTQGLPINGCEGSVAGYSFILNEGKATLQSDGQPAYPYWVRDSPTLHISGIPWRLISE